MVLMGWDSGFAVHSLPVEYAVEVSSTEGRNCTNVIRPCEDIGEHLQRLFLLGACGYASARVLDN